MKVKQWKNSSAVIKWFRNMENKPNCSFFIFDIQDFYSSVSLSEELNLEKKYTNDEISILMQSRKTLLFTDGEPCFQKDDEDDFNVPMGCYDGAEVCELVGTYLLNQLMVVIAKENMELYRHDGVGIFKSVSGTEVEFKTEELVTIFKNNGVSITVKANLEIVCFIDIYFNLVKEIYHLYKKPNDDPLYFNKKSNDPLSIL